MSPQEAAAARAQAARHVAALAALRQRPILVGHPRQDDLDRIDRARRAAHGPKEGRG